MQTCCCVAIQESMRSLHHTASSAVYRLKFCLFLPLMLASEAVQAAPGFVMPSRNIWCLQRSGRAGLICDIVQKQWPAWDCRDEGCLGYRFLLPEQGAAVALRSSDTLAGSVLPLFPYGTSRRFGRIQCLSSPEGLDCRNRSGGRLQLNRERFRLNEP